MAVEQHPRIRADALRAALLEMAGELDERGQGKMTRFFKATGPYRRELYPKHLAFFKAGKVYRERGAISANRVGKSLMGAFETTVHLTGEYPDWWEGRRFEEPVNWWVCGDTATTVRDIMQEQLLGPWGAIGTGFIPRHLIVHSVPKRGVANAMDTVWVKHATGGRSKLQFKSYESGRKGFQGTSQHGIECDEEPPYDCYEECLLRTTKTSDFPGGMLMLTFTPLSGLTDVVREFYPRQIDQEDAGAPLQQSDEDSFGAVPGIAKRFRVRITWDDVPHLTEEEKADFMTRLRPYQREARTRGVPQLGSGAIFPFPVGEFKVDPFEIPPEWPRGFALDAQALWKSSLHAAYDRETSTWYLYGEYKREMASTPDHAQSLIARGQWIPGVGDAMGLVREGERTQYIDLYRDLGIDIERAEKSVEAGIQDVYDLFSKGQIRVFSTLRHFFDEFETYQRDERGRVVKKNDHLMDCLRMLIRGHHARGDNWMKTFVEANPPENDMKDREVFYDDRQRHAWMR